MGPGELIAKLLGSYTIAGVLVAFVFNMGLGVDRVFVLFLLTIFFGTIIFILSWLLNIKTPKS